MCKYAMEDNGAKGRTIEERNIQLFNLYRSIIMERMSAEQMRRASEFQAWTVSRYSEIIEKLIESAKILKPIVDKAILETRNLSWEARESGKECIRDLNKYEIMFFIIMEPANNYYDMVETNDQTDTVKNALFQRKTARKYLNILLGLNVLILSNGSNLTEILKSEAVIWSESDKLKLELESD